MGAMDQGRSRKIMAYFTPEQADCIEKLADMDQRSMSWIVNEAVVEYCRKRKQELHPLSKKA